MHRLPEGTSLLRKSWLRLLLIAVCACGLGLRHAAAQSGVPAPPAPANQDAKQDPKQDTSQDKSSYKASPDQELSSHDTPATFKVRVNLVLVRVVVRDSDGKPVPNLK